LFLDWRFDTAFKGLFNESMDRRHAGLSGIHPRNGGEVPVQVKRSISTNTAAAGGNASLMTLAP
jgi:hypothetical protein